MAADKLIPFLQDGIQSLDFDEYVRYFNNYMIAEDKLNVEENRKIAIFLNSVGAEAQRQYYTLPKASTVTSLSEAIDLLRQRYVVKSRPWARWLKTVPMVLWKTIRDRFIVGTKIKQLRDRLLVETTDLNLDQVVQLATQYEKAQEDNMFDNTPEGINKIAANDRRTEPNLRERKNISTSFKCLRCGGRHKATSPDCPAKDVKCHQCLKAYHQIRLHPDSRYLTAFITHMGIYQFKRLPYGLSSAPGAFQRYLSERLMDIKGVSCYLDDIIIEGSSMEDHDKKLNQVLSRLREVNLMLNDAKSIYRQKSLKCLGHIIDDNGVHLDEELMKPLLDAPPLKDKSGLRSLIGMINWFQKYIPNKSTIMEPLQELLKKSVPFKWRGEHAKALQTVKDSLKKGQVLALFCPKLPTVITTDASHSGIGCVVSQLSEKGEERIVACASRTLSDAERKYSIVEKEAFACNDRAGLRIARWSARLMNFDYNIEYKKGRDNVLPDYLSRSSLSSYEDYDGEVELIASINQDMLAISEEEFLRECSLCPEIIALKEQLIKPWSNNESSQLNKYFRLRKDLSVQEDLILNEKGKILVPIGFRFAITLIDYTSKWPEVFCTNKTTFKVIINFLEDVFSREGFPREIVTDNGIPFISEEFEDFLGSNGIKHIRTANYHPACNGEVENFNKTLKSTVLTAHLQHTEDKRTIQLFLREYRSTPHTVTKQTPSAVLHGRTLRTLVHVFDKEVKTKPPEEACRQEDKSDSESKSCSPKLQVVDQVKVQAGDSVMKGRSKLRGPFTITKQLRPFTFVLSDGEVWNACRLRLYQKCAGTYTRPDTRNELEIHPALHLDDHASQEESTSPPDSSPIASRLRSKYILAPFYDLLKKNSKWNWTSEHRILFAKCKALLTNESVLAHDATRELVLACDASSYGLGVVMSHRNDRKEETPIAFASRTLTEAERRYSQLEKEALSIIFGCEKFRQYLLGREFVLITDNRPLMHIFSLQKPIPICAASRIKRSLKLAAFKYTVEFRKTDDNGNADALSRLPLGSKTTESLDEDQVLLLRKMSEVPFLFQDVAVETRRDKLLSIVLRNVRENNWQIPKTVFWWPGINKNIEELARDCRICQETASMPPSTISEWTWPEKPWHRLHLDLAGPFMGRMFMVLVDAYTKWLEIVIIKDITSRTIIGHLREIFARFGLPEILVTDNGRQFVSSEFEEFTTINGIRHTKTSPYNPSTNGFAERYVREFKNSLRKNQGKDSIEINLQRFLFTHRAFPQTVLKEYPAELLMKRSIRSRFSNLIPKMAKVGEVYHDAVRKQEHF
ncbi:hypothetical protein LAZ67_12002238 [Cordylochernes scorpioides]|uniref:Integrase catalytic domain-containing protein n=1 Tax=Cordylochernes scorpioides TaxID=51811 RepID=A0ABY6L3K3_9ARAC|nr:hypothetical protein LAZ67_12002238 [Cordylochernes scorpioides]